MEPRIRYAKTSDSRQHRLLDAGGGRRAASAARPCSPPATRTSSKRSPILATKSTTNCWTGSDFDPEAFDARSVDAALGQMR